MKILFVSAEVAPFVSVGGMSQVMYFLPRSLKKLGHDVRIFTPKYGSMDNNRTGKVWSLHMEFEGLKVPVEHSFTEKEGKKGYKEALICNIKTFSGRKPNQLVYFLENQEYYEMRANVFGYSDDHIRFSLLSKGCLEWLLQVHKQNAKKSKLDYWWPDIIQCNDWHTAYLIELAKKDTRYKTLFEKTPIIITVHNFAYQGNYDFRYAPLKERDNGTEDLEPILSPKLQKQNVLLRGIHYADAVNTVSPTHAIEVLTEEYAEGMDEELQRVRGKIIGILNGLDTKEFNPATDPIIKQKFTENSFIHARKVNKIDLQKSFFLPENIKAPLLAICGRLSQQKGWDLLHEALPRFFEHYSDVQLIVLGGGDDGYRNKLQLLQQKFPDRIGIHPRSDFRLPRKLFAGADIFLIPSIFEPGGIVALEALRYGSVPIVRRTGGLNDIITDFNPATGKGNGFSFTTKDPWALYGSLVEAITIYKQPKLWKKLIENCLNENHSWDTVAKKYESWYRNLLEERRRAKSLTPHPAYVP